MACRDATGRGRPASGPIQGVKRFQPALGAAAPRWIMSDQYARRVRLRDVAYSLRRSIRDVPALGPQMSSVRRDIDVLRAQVGALEARFVRDLSSDRITEAEFRVFSQFGEDGIIQYLVDRVPIESEVFVEFGVQDYAESNTRFLLVNNNWRGLIIDAGDAHIQLTSSLGLDWQYQLDAVQAFIEPDNINDLITGAGIQGEIGLLSVDIDGNDYWVLEKIDAVSPSILVTEYNSTWGPDAAVTVPYDRAFRRTMAHPSNLYWGASLDALTRLANRRGYALVAGNRAGNNAFFVRRDVLGDLREEAVSAVYRPSRFRESLGANGHRTYISDHTKRLELLASMPLWDVGAEELTTVRDRFGVGH
jgi:hypothetical protein